MKKADVARIVLWAIWTIYTGIMLYKWTVSEMICKLFQNISAWIYEHPTEVMTIIWGAFTIGLVIDLAIRFNSTPGNDGQNKED